MQPRRHLVMVSTAVKTSLQIPHCIEPTTRRRLMELRCRNLNKNYDGPLKCTSWADSNICRVARFYKCFTSQPPLFLVMIQSNLSRNNQELNNKYYLCIRPSLTPEHLHYVCSFLTRRGREADVHLAIPKGRTKTLSDAVIIKSAISAAYVRKTATSKCSRIQKRCYCRSRGSNMQIIR